MEQVILVDEHDADIGLMEKMEAHEKGALHRAFSLYVFNSKGEHLLHHRAASKYHGGDLWTNACCSHPRAGESVPDAIHRRLMEEMGLRCPSIAEIGTTIYKAEVGNNLVEHEYLHVYVAITDDAPDPNPEEADGWKYMGDEELQKDLEDHPDKYTPWFRIVYPRMREDILSVVQQKLSE